MKIIVIGNSTVDLAFRVDHLPRPVESLLASAHAQDGGGKGANQAVAAARAGATVWFCSAIGHDPNGSFLRSLLAKEAIDLTYLFERAAPSDQSIIYVSDTGENCIVSSAEVARSLTVTDTRLVCQRLDAGDILLIRSFHALNKPVQHRACKVETVEMPVTKAFLANSAWGVNSKDLWSRSVLLKQSHYGMQENMQA